MKKVTGILMLTTLTVLLSGCLSSGVEIEVNKDGSGRIIQTFNVQKEYMAFMNLGEAEVDPNMINKEELTARARLMGEGVSFEKVEALSEDSIYAGYTAYYSFSDITKVRTTATPMTSPVEMETDSSEWITFEFKKGGTSRLTVLSSTGEDDDDDDWDSDDEDDYDTESSPGEDDGMKEQLKQIYKTMHFWFKIKVNGNISDTNALYSDNSEVILMDMKFEKIVENDDLFSHITSESSSDLDEVRDELEKAGVKVDDQEKIEISFR